MPMSVNHRVKEEAEEMAENREGNMAKIRETKEWIQTLLVVATLIAAVTFAAPLAIPGGVSSDRGIPVRMHSAALKAFIITDTLALCFSMSAVILCFNVHRSLFRYNFVNYRFSQKSAEEVFGVKTTFKWANILVQCAFMSTMVSYSFGLYVLVAPRCLWLAIITFTAAWAVPFVGAVWQIALFLKLIREPVNDDEGVHNLTILEAGEMLADATIRGQRVLPEGMMLA